VFGGVSEQSTLPDRNARARSQRETGLELLRALVCALGYALVCALGYALVRA
jgi:hypothetical protein